MDLALNNLQRLICHKTNQTNKQTNKSILLTVTVEYGASNPAQVIETPTPLSVLVWR